MEDDFLPTTERIGKKCRCKRFFVWHTKALTKHRRTSRDKTRTLVLKMSIYERVKKKLWREAALYERCGNIQVVSCLNQPATSPRRLKSWRMASYEEKKSGAAGCYGQWKDLYDGKGH